MRLAATGLPVGGLSREEDYPNLFARSSE